MLEAIWPVECGVVRHAGTRALTAERVRQSVRRTLLMAPRRWAGRDLARPARRARTYWAAGPNKQGPVIAVALSLLSTMLLMACGGFGALGPTQSASAAGVPRLAEVAFASTDTPTGTPGSSPTVTPTPSFPSTEVINTPTPTPATSPTASTTPGATVMRRRPIPRRLAPQPRPPIQPRLAPPPRRPILRRLARPPHPPTRRPLVRR